MHKHKYHERCLVAPHPDLLKKMMADLQKAKRGAASVANLLSISREKPPGMDDGMIYPGDHFPLGTSVRAVRSAALERAPLSGSVRVIVVLASFTDKAMVKTQQHFKNLFFSTGLIPTGSVKEYYTEASNGKIDIIGDVVGPFVLPQKLSQYANGGSGTNNTNPNARDMARDAANAANPSVNFAPFDNNGDGFVDAFIVIHAGKGAEVTGSVNDIWSHKWVFKGSALNADGTKVFAYLTVPEDSNIGVCCHELGHLLFGWPDLYDTDDSSSGLGNWCLMAGGSWNGAVPGNTPAHPSAWCKANQGWVSVVNQTTNQNVTIADVKTGQKVYRLWKNGGPGSEYFLVENRQKTKFDSKLPGSGLLVYHIDDATATNSNENHPKVKLMEADGLNQLKTGANRGDGGDPFPGTANKTTFNKSSTPNSLSYGNVDTCVAVTNIGVSGANMTARLTVQCKTKEISKEISKEVTKEKEFAKEKDIAKEIEKGPEKSPVEKGPKEFEKAGESLSSGARQGRRDPTVAGLEACIAALQGVVKTLDPFIGSELRPDVAGGALANDADFQEAQSRMSEGVAEAKRSYDTKPSEGKLRES